MCGPHSKPRRQLSKKELSGDDRRTTAPAQPCSRGSRQAQSGAFPKKLAQQAAPGLCTPIFPSSMLPSPLCLSPQLETENLKGCHLMLEL